MERYNVIVLGAGSGGLTVAAGAGGPIGAELGQAFARLGAAVTIVSGSDHILPREESDVAAVLAERLRREGVTLHERGIQIDRTCRTTVPSVWAVGDVAGLFQFTHWANYQARIVVRNVLFPGTWQYDDTTVPWTTFTEPEVARVELSEDDARRRNILYDVYRAAFEDNDHALCDGEPEGFVKVLTRRGTGRILGAAVVHEHAGELFLARAFAWLRR